MSQIPKKPFDLEERALIFAKGIVNLCRKIRKDPVNLEMTKQLVRSACSVGANYREANEALSKKDFTHRMRITRKECKESSYWLELLKDSNDNFVTEIDSFIVESKELRNIFSAVITKTSPEAIRL